MRRKKMDTNSNNMLLVFYIGVLHVEASEIGEYINQAAEKMVPKNFEGTVLFFPSLESSESRVECINPRYVTDTRLIEENELLLKNLNKKINELTIDTD